MEKYVDEGADFAAERDSRAHDCVARILGTAGAIGVGVIVWRVQLTLEVDPLVAASTSGLLAMIMLMLIWVSCEDAAAKLVRARGWAPKLARIAQRLYPHLAYDSGLFAYKDRIAPWIVRVVMRADPLGVWSRPEGAVSMYYIVGGCSRLAPPRRVCTGDFPIREHIAGSPDEYWLLNTFMIQTNMEQWALERRAALDRIQVLDTENATESKCQIKNYVDAAQKAVHDQFSGRPTEDKLVALEEGTRPITKPDDEAWFRAALSTPAL